MSKKLNFFPEIQKRPPTKRELIAASEYAKSPTRIAELAGRLAFVREDVGTVKGGRHVVR
jgi:hypothetical protein